MAATSKLLTIEELVEAIVEQEVKLQRLEVQCDAAQQKLGNIMEETDDARNELAICRANFNKFLTDKATRRRHST